MVFPFGSYAISSTLDISKAAWPADKVQLALRGEGLAALVQTDPRISQHYEAMAPIQLAEDCWRRGRSSQWGPAFSNTLRARFSHTIAAPLRGATRPRPWVQDARACTPSAGQRRPTTRPLRLAGGCS